MSIKDDIITSCFLCGSVDFMTSRWLKYGPIQLIRWRQCALMHLYPVYQHSERFETLNAEETGRQVELLKHTDSTGINHSNGILDLIENEGKQYSGRLLDVGCKYGDMLVAARNRGWAVVGVEPNTIFGSIARSRGFEIHNDVIERLDPDIDKFDLIVMSHVLEHIERPDTTLRSIFNMLNPNGLLYVETPDASSPIAWGVYRGRWLGVATPGHVWAFTTETLKKAVSTCGFNVIWHDRWIPYAPHDYPMTIKGQVRRFLFSIINRLGYGDIAGILAEKPAVF